MKFVILSLSSTKSGSSVLTHVLGHDLKRNAFFISHKFNSILELNKCYSSLPFGDYFRKYKVNIGGSNLFVKRFCVFGDFGECFSVNIFGSFRKIVENVFQSSNSLSLLNRLLLLLLLQCLTGFGLFFGFFLRLVLFISSSIRIFVVMESRTSLSSLESGASMSSNSRSYCVNRNTFLFGPNFNSS